MNRMRSIASAVCEAQELIREIGCLGTTLRRASESLSQAAASTAMAHGADHEFSAAGAACPPVEDLRLCSERSRAAGARLGDTIKTQDGV